MHKKIIKIAFIHSVAKIGGAERVSQMLMLGLDKHAFSCTLICPDLGELCDWATEHAIPSHQLPLGQPGLSNAFATIKQSVEWIRWFNTNQIDIVHTADPYCTRAITLAAAMSGVKVLSHFHFPFERKQLSWILKRLPKPDICVFCSEDLQQEVGAHLQSIVPNIPMSTIHNGVDITRFKPTKNIKSDSVHIGIVANLQKRKGHDEFIHMAALLAKDHDGLCFHIIGGDILEEPREPKLKQLAGEMGIADCITFHGQVADVLSLLDKLDIVVCASHQEAFPIAILEAMAMQKAIVSTNVNGIPEAIIDKESGLLVNPYNPVQLALAVSQLIDSPDMRESLASNARKRVVEHFNLNIFTDRFEALYKEILR